MQLNNKEKSELDYLRGFKKGVEDAIKLIYGEEQLEMIEERSKDLPESMPCKKIEKVEFKNVTPEEMGNILDDLKNKILGGNQ